MGNKFGSATRAALDALGGEGTKMEQGTGATTGSRYGSATTAALDALIPAAPAAQPQAVNRYQNYLDMGDIIRQESQADKGVAISPQMIMAEFMKRQQNGTEPVAQLTNPENTGARIQRYENNRQRLAALDSQIRGYGQAVLHPGKDNTVLKQLMAQRDALALEQQQYERLYKLSDYGAAARKQADFTERAAVTSHEDDPEYIAVNYSRYPLPEEQFHTEAESKKYAYADLNSLNPRRAEPGKAVTVTDDPVLNRAKDMSQYSGFRNMTDEERDTYNYLYETRGKEVAHQYLQDQIIDVDKRESQKAAEATAKAYEEASIPAKIATNLATVPASILGGAVGALSDAATAIGGKYNPYSPAHGMTEFAQTVRGKTAEEIAAGISNETVGAFASNTYQAIMSAADSVLGAYTMGPAYTVAMGAGAASSRAKELYEQGASNMQVLQGSLAAGVAETLFEYVSLDKLIKTGASETVKEWVTNILKQSFTEASEEVSTEITNKVFDAIIRGGKSDHGRAEQAYIEAGETPENARRLAWRDDVTDILWAGYGGAVSGGLSAAGYGGIATMQHIQEVKQVGQRYLTEDSGGKTRLTEAMEIGLSNAQGTEALETAQGIQRQIAQGKQPTAYQVGKMLLESTTEKALRAREIEGEILNSARENGVNDKTAQAVAALMVRADRAARFVSPETLQTVGEGDGQYSIVTLDDGKTYVTYDRNVLSGTNPHNWRQQINQFFNDVLLENGSLTVDTVDGDTMTITKRETVGKGKDKFTQIGGTRYELTNEEYYVKLQALSHIDELTETAQYKRDVQGNIKAYPDTKSHSFARDGFAYPVVFFEDADGNYYKITLSVGMENGIGTVYNIGRMQKTDKPTRAILSVIGSKVNRRDSSIAGSQALGLSVSDTTIPQNGSGVNTQYMQNSGENAPVYQAAGRYTADGVVELASNITTDEAMDFVIKHELTHAIEGSAAYTKLKRLVRQQMGEEEYAAAVERERQSRSAKGDTQGAADAEAEVVADWIAQNLYRDGFARMIRNMDGGAAVRFQAVLDSFRRTLGFTGNMRQAAAIRWAERAFAEVLDSDYSSANENTAAENGDGGKYDMTIPFAEQVNQAINHTLNPRNALYVGETSDILQKVGLSDLPMLYTQRNLADAIRSKADGGHGLTVNDILAMPEIVQHPALVMDSLTRDDSIVLASDRLDGDGYPIIMTVRANGTGTYDLQQISSNFITSYYGKDSDFSGFIERAIAADKVLYIDKKKSQALYRQAGLQLPYGFQRLGFDTIIHSSNNVVNTQSMQNSENNSSDGQKSYLPAEILERENAAAAEKAENARRLAEERAEKQRQQEAQTRQQREETAGELQRKNAALQQRLERAQREIRLTTEKTVRAEDVAKLTRKILREYSSTLKSDSILDAMQALGDTIVQGGQLDYDTLHGQALDIARQIIDRSEALIDDGESATYDGIRQYLRENKIAVSEEEKADIPDYEAWRRRNQRRMNLSKEGTPVDVIYGEMQELFGKELLPDILNPSEQLQYLAELRDNMEPEYGNPYESDMEQAVEACAGDILDGMLSAQVRQTSPTFADKAQAQLERQKNLAHAALEREVQRRHKALETQRTKMQAQAQAAQERAEARRERSLETQRNRYQDLLTREKVKTAEARVQGENAVRETKAENRQRNRDAAERRKKTAEKQRVGKMLDSLESMLAKPDKNHHIPAAATEAVRNLLATVREDPADIQAQINELQLKLQDTSDGRQIDRIRRRIAERQARLDKTTSLYEAVGKVQDTYGDIAGETVEGKPVNSGFQHYLQEVKEMVEDRRVSDLSAAELHELVEVIKAVHGQLKQMNTLHGKAFREGAQETGLQMAEEMTAAKGYSNTALRNFMLWQLTPDRFLEAICGWKQDSVGAKLAAEMVEAQRTELEIQRAYGKRFYDLVNGSNAKNYDRLSSTKDSDLVDVGLVDSQGKPMKMTRGLMLSLYESLCCKGNRQALTDGGMMLPQLKLYYSGKAADAYVHSQALTPTALSGEIHNVLEEMNKFPTGSQEYANLHKEYMELVGRANQDLDRLKARIEGEMTDYERQLHRAIRQWFDKDSKEYLNDVTTRLWNYEAARVKDYFPIYRSKDFVSTALESLVTDRTLASNGNLKARLKSKAPVLIADITQVLNRSAAQTARFCGWTPFQEDFTRIYNANDRDKGLSFKQALGLKWGAGKAHLGATGNQYIQNLMADISGGREGGSSFLRFFRQNAVRATLSVNMRVAVSQAASLPTAAAEIGWKYTARAMKHLAEVNQQTMDRIADYSAYFYERRRGAGGMEEFALAKDGSNVLDKAYQSLDKATKGRLLNWCQEVDIRTVALCWFGCEEAIRDTRPELKAGSDAYYKAVGEMLDRVIIKTQPNFTTAQRSDLLRTKNEAVKFLTMYKTQANQNMNILYEVTGRLRAALQSGDKAQIQAAKKAMVNGYTAVIAGGTIAFVLLRTLVNLLQHRVKGYRDKDGEITAASMTGAIGQEVLSSMAGMFAFGDAVYDVVSARVFGERYYGVSDVALGNVSSLLEDFATGNFTSETAWRNLWRDTMNALGVPWKNLEDIAGGIIGHITDIAHGEFLSFNANSGLETAAYYRQLLHAQQNGKTEKAAKVREFLLTSGKTETQIQAGLRKVIQEDSDFQKREKRLLREAMESVMYRSMTEKEQKKVKSGLDGYLADTMLEGSIGSKMTTAHQKAQKIIDRGVSPAAYYVGEAAKNGTTADKNGDGTVTRQEYRAMLSQSDYDQITQAVLLAQKSNSKKK